MRSAGRPPVSPVQLKNGFYIEVCDKGSNKGMKIWSVDEKAMQAAARLYAGYKNVILLGEYKDGKFTVSPVTYK
ncbi:hypothetical protein [Paraflavitalea sp. CAU 1676]|uniref:hypothetical protein n=1 Tax=Paraflavitalea sp. CAU 1676 TaxID=3032598 RepID=UPI0023DC06BC|nr:hypothetical protein [Paraflavitalea sp. CAU 1676]MDF2191637.1 hypothetical protein [Paraflavitalea sp. CAU 1676]